MSGPVLRHGRRVPIHLYAQYGPEPADHDPAVGTVWVEYWARKIVRAMAGEPGTVSDLRELVEHYRRRGEMSPSERQSILGEDADASSEPERSAYQRAAQSLAGNLTDTEGIHWTMQTARRLGIDDRGAADLIGELADQLREHGRPLTAETAARISGGQRGAAMTEAIDLVLTVPCPAIRCHALPGDPCKDDKGGALQIAHGVRWLAQHQPGPLVPCDRGPCLACWWTGWEPAVPTDAQADAAERRRLEAYLHSKLSHPDFEYEETRGPRKAWDGESDPPEIDARGGWVRNLHHGRDGWERFDYHEEAYWMRPKEQG